MKVTKQLSNRKFEVELEDEDFDINNEFVIQHDYVRIISSERLFTEGDFNVEIDGRPLGNIVPIKMQATIGIRDFQNIYNKHLSNHPYLNPDHLLKSDGSPNYTWNDEELLEVYDGETRKTTYYVREKDKIYEIPEVIYKRLKKAQDAAGEY